MQAHVLAHFLQLPGETREVPRFPFLCLTVSGGHTQIVFVEDYFTMKVVGETLDDAAGEAFDKVSKMLGLPYPGGPLIDSLAREGNPKAYSFPHPQIKNLDYSFSGFKTSVLYFLRDRLMEDSEFIKKNLNDLCASVQQCIVEILLDKLNKALKVYPVRDIALAGGVSANSSLRESITELAKQRGLVVHIPPPAYCTDNAGMIAIAAWYRYQAGLFTDQSVTPLTRMTM
jgi:N6-L-threonylcarbamoyladenine synthase